MYIVDGIAYAGEPSPAIKVCGVRPLDDFKPVSYTHLDVYKRQVQGI